MGRCVNGSFWSDEDRWFVRRAFGLGHSLNLKYMIKRLGWIRAATLSPSDEASTKDGVNITSEKLVMNAWGPLGPTRTS